MEKQFVTYEIALKLKELGFDECCLAVYFKNKFQLVKGFNINNVDLHVANEMDAVLAPLWQQIIDWCDSKGLLVGTIIVDNLYKSTINKINYETELFHSRNESIKQAIAFAISYLQDNK